MHLYGMFLRDLSASLPSAPSVHFISPYARFFFKHRPQTYITNYISNTHREQPYSETLPDEYVHTIANGISFAGDPLASDIITNFCNDSEMGHWYLLILDQRAGQHKTVTMYDSSFGSSGYILAERCAYLIEFINSFRNHVRHNYSDTIRWLSCSLRVKDFRFRNGGSQQQRNGFDCGVFSLINAECFTRAWNHNDWEPTSLPLFRLMAIWNLTAFSHRTGVPL